MADLTPFYLIALRFLTAGVATSRPDYRRGVPGNPGLDPDNVRRCRCEIPSVTATVTHTAGGADFTMRDTGGTTFTGTDQPAGDFSSTAVFGRDSATKQGSPNVIP